MTRIRNPWLAGLGKSHEGLELIPYWMPKSELNDSKGISRYSFYMRFVASPLLDQKDLPRHMDLA